MRWESRVSRPVRVGADCVRGLMALNTFAGDFAALSSKWSGIRRVVSSACDLLERPALILLRPWTIAETVDRKGEQVI
jgi:hypothetical protein